MQWKRIPYGCHRAFVATGFQVKVKDIITKRKKRREKKKKAGDEEDVFDRLILVLHERERESVNERED